MEFKNEIEEIKKLNKQEVTDISKDRKVFDMTNVNIQTKEYAIKSLENRQDDIKLKVDSLVEKEIKVEFEKTMNELREKDKLNKVVKQQIKNELIESKSKAVLLKRQARQDKKMQKLKHRQEFNSGFVKRNNLNGDENWFSWYWFKSIDFLKQTLSKTVEITGLANKLVWRVLLYILLAVFVFVEPVRTFLIGLIGG